MDVDFSKMTIGRLFTNPVESGEEFLSIPQFQRNYVWDKEEEVLRLLEDFFDNANDSYFWGPIILKYEPGVSDYVDIVDGQQRVTTFNMLISCFRDHIRKLISDKNLKSETGFKLDLRFGDLIVVGEEFNQKPKLKLSRKVNKGFRENIILNQDKNKIDQLKLNIQGEDETFRKLKSTYLKIYNYIGDRLAEVSTDDYKGFFSNILQALKNKHYFLAIYVEDSNDAFSIFESINAKGKELTTAELVKNLSFQNIYDLHRDDNRLLDELESQWDEMESQISNFTNFIYHLWVSIEGNTKKKQVYREVKEYLDNASITDTKKFIQLTLPDESLAYSKFENVDNIDPNDSLSEVRKYHYDTLKTLRASRCYPLLLSLEFCHREKLIEENLISEILETITNLTFWYSSICENDGKKLEREYHSIARSIRQNQEETFILEHIETLKGYFPKKELCKTNFYTKDFTNKALAKYILRNLEKKLKGDSVYDLSSSGYRVNIEHILPLNPSNKGKWFDYFSQVEHSENKWKIGNLTLLHAKENRRISNKDFSIKKEIYKKSEIEMNSFIGNKSEWNPVSIKGRTKELFDQALTIWKYPN